MRLPFVNISKEKFISIAANFIIDTAEEIDDEIIETNSIKVSASAFIDGFGKIRFENIEAELTHK